MISCDLFDIRIFYIFYIVINNEILIEQSTPSLEVFAIAVQEENYTCHADISTWQ